MNEDGSSFVTENKKKLNILRIFKIIIFDNEPNALGNAHCMPGVDGAVNKDNVADIDVGGAVENVGPLDALVQKSEVKVLAENILTLLLQKVNWKVLGVRMSGLIGRLVPKTQRRIISCLNSKRNSYHPNSVQVW